MKTKKHAATKPLGAITGYFLWGIAAVCALSCAAASSSRPSDARETASAKNDGKSEDSSPLKCASKDPSLPNADAAILFEYDHVPTFDIYLPPDAWKALQRNALDEEYTTAEACFEGRGIGVVGLRFKGAYGSLRHCFNEKNENICRKLGMKLKFDKYDSDNRFFGLKRLNFQSYRYDESYMKERLAYDLYKAAGITTPRALWANVRVNGELLGLFGMVEQIDGQFVKKRWKDNSDGNLYKETWPGKTDAERAMRRLKTNKGTADVSSFVAFSEAVRSANDDELRSTLEKHIDLDYWARYMAVDDATANYDGVTAFYVSKSSSHGRNHNFYLYEDAPAHFTIIPWDVESTFSVGTFGNVPHWMNPPEDCSTRYPSWGKAETLVTAAGCDPVFRALTADLTVYRQTAKELLDGPLSEEAMAAAVDKYAAFIRKSVEADPNGPGISSFEGDVALFKRRIPKLRMRLSNFVQGKSWTPFEIDVNKINDLESQDATGLILGPQIYKNATTSVSVTLNTDSPIRGGRDAMISFELDDDKAGWGQWLNYIVPMRGGSQDVTGLSGIRIWVRADKSRDLRIELDNIHTSGVNGWLREGWTVSVTEEPRQIEVLFQDAAYPAWAAAQGKKPLVDLADALTGIKGLLFSPQCTGLDAAGYLPGDAKDSGFVEIDDIEFF